MKKILLAALCAVSCGTAGQLPRAASDEIPRCAERFDKVFNDVWGQACNELHAKMGQFFLDRGMWKGRRLLAQEWFIEAMKPQIMQYEGRMSPAEAAVKYADDEWNQGYGYQMWMYTNGAVRFDGAWGQYIIIAPEKRLVVAVQSHTGDCNACIRSVWNNIYDAL